MTLNRLVPLIFCVLTFDDSVSLAFSIGDKVQANGTVNVRQTAAGTLLGTQSSGTQGAVIGGPTVATLNGTTYTWYNIDWPASPDGWVADIGLVSAAPTVQTLSATSITISGAQLQGTIAPNGSSTTAYFQYGLTSSYGTTTASGNFGTTAQTIGFSISGLSASTTYHYRIVAVNGTGTSLGGDVTFTTAAQPTPTVQTLAATSITTTSAQLNGSLYPNGANTTAYFQYGLTASYGSTTSSGNFGTTSQNIGTSITGLTPNTPYHYRIVASNSGGISVGSDATFTTASQPAPTVQTLAASSVTTTGGQLNGSITPNGASTSAYFEYGTSTSYGSGTISGNFGTTAQNIGTTISGLAPGTTYHYRIVASNSGGTSRGSDVTFTTLPVTSPGPVVQTLQATYQTPSSAQLNGYLNPNGASATAHFEYGPSTSYGSSTLSGNFGLTPQNIGYNVTALAPNTTYHYRFVAFNANGTTYGLDSSFSTASSPLSTPPTITTQPQGQTLQAGGTVTFSVSVSGSTPISYEWRRNGAVLPGQTGATLTLNPVTAPDSGGYSVRVTNPYGSQTSATAWLSVYSSPPANPPPGNPVVVVTTKPPIPPVIVPVSDTQLKVYSGGAFVNSGSVDLSKMTIVLTHGWNSDPTNWPKDMAADLVTSKVNANILAWNWSAAADTTVFFLSRAFSAIPSQGQKLGQALSTTLGTSYGKPIHFAGHSLGTLVNATAANYLHEQTGGAFDPLKTHMTLFDDAEIASLENAFVVIRGDQVPGLDGLLPPIGVPSLGWISPIPRRSGWIDNYISLVGGRHSEAVNVFLGQSFSRSWSINLKTFIENTHSYACTWYGDTAAQPSMSTLGNRYSFEELGLTTSPAQACPFPVNSLLAQSDFPADPYPLHIPTLAEVASLETLRASAIVGSGFLSGVESLANNGERLGEAYLNVVISSTAILSDAATVASHTFYSLGAVLNSAANSLPPSGSKKGPQPGPPGAAGAPPCLWLPISIPTNAVLLSFDFTFTGTAGTDVISASIEGTNVFALEAALIPQNQKLNSGSIPVVKWAGTNVELFLGLLGDSSSNATVTIDAVRFYQAAAPTLSIAASNNQVAISWSSMAQGYTLQSAGTLVGNNQWSDVTNVPSVTGLWNSVTNTVGSQNMFYRLKK